MARRYLFSSGSNTAINIISGIAATGVVIGAMSLFVVLSGFAGLKKFSLQFSSYCDPDLKILPKTGKRLLLTDKQRAQLENLPEIIAFTESIEERVFLAYKSKHKTAFIKGVAENYADVIAVDSMLFHGNWLSNNDYQVVSGSGISSVLGMGVEKTITNVLHIYTPKPGTGIISNPVQAFRKQSAVNIGLYSVNEELDQKYVFSTLHFAQKLLGQPKNSISQIELKIQPNTDKKAIRTKLRSILGHNILIKNRIQLQDALYKMLNTENLVSYLVITLIAIIALCNVAGAILMIVVDKKANIRTLWSLGATLQRIQMIFFLQGALMTVLGAGLGVVLGLLLILAQQYFELLLITPSLAYPTEITTTNIALAFFTIVLIGCVASALASRAIQLRK